MLYETEVAQYFPPRGRRAARNSAVIERLAKLAVELADDSTEGITVSDIRLEAFKRNILTGRESGRELSFLSSVPVAAGLLPTGRYKRSNLAVSHGNLQMVWVADGYDPYLYPYAH
jgi:hypothetical protein